MVDRETSLSRRGMLGVLGATALPGCSGLPQFGPRHHEVGDRVSLDEGSVAVKAVTLRAEVVVGGRGRDLEILSNPAGQWLFVAVDDTTVVEQRTERSRFHLEYGDRRVEALLPQPRGPLMVRMGDRPAVEWDLALPFPAVSLEEATVGWSDGDRPVRWTVPSSILEQATSLPDLVVEDFRVPSNVPDGEAPTARFTFHNRGDRTTIANALVTVAAPSGEDVAPDDWPVGISTVEVGWDERKPVDGPVPVDFGKVDRAIDIELRTRVGSMSQRVSVE